MKILHIVNNISKDSSQGIDKYSREVVGKINNMDQKIVERGNSSTLINIFWEKVILPWRVLFSNVEICHYHTPELFGPLQFIFCKSSIVTIHDMLPYSKDNERSKFYCNYYRLSCWFVGKFAKKIITPSEYSKKKIVELLDFNPKKIEVIPHGIDHNRTVQNKTKKIKTIGYLGGFGKRKNLQLIVKLFERLVIKYPNLRLILGGTGPTKEETIYSLEEKKLLKKSIIYDEIAEKDWFKILAGIDLFLMPSIGEGFGLPVLQSQACGIPVISFANTSLTELNADKRLLVEGGDEDFISRVNWVVGTDKVLLKLKKKAFYFSSGFSWEKCILSHEKVYKSLKR
jgi:glycosyltransferase involved in cell wall biosynthesis